MGHEAVSQPKILLDTLALHLTDGIAGVPRGARVDATAPPLRVLRHMRRRNDRAIRPSTGEAARDSVRGVLGRASARP